MVEMKGVILFIKRFWGPDILYTVKAARVDLPPTVDREERGEVKGQEDLAGRAKGSSAEVKLLTTRAGFCSL